MHNSLWSNEVYLFEVPHEIHGRQVLLGGDYIDFGDPGEGRSLEEGTPTSTLNDSYF